MIENFHMTDAEYQAAVNLAKRLSDEVVVLRDIIRRLEAVRELRQTVKELEEAA